MSVPVAAGPEVGHTLGMSHAITTCPRVHSHAISSLQSTLSSIPLIKSSFNKEQSSPVFFFSLSFSGENLVRSTGFTGTNRLKRNQANKTLPRLSKSLLVSDVDKAPTRMEPVAHPKPIPGPRTAAER